MKIIKATKVDKDRLVKKACSSCGHETESLISDEWDKHLTQDKEYEVEGEAGTHYMIRNDAGVLQWFFKKKFAVLGDSLSGKTAGCESADEVSITSPLTKFKVGDSFELPDKSTCIITEVESIPDAGYLSYTVKHDDGEESVYGENLLTHARKLNA